MSDHKYTTVAIVAGRLGLPVSFLRREIKAGRLPHVRVGKRIYADPDAIAQALQQRAAAEAKAGSEGGDR